MTSAAPTPDPRPVLTFEEEGHVYAADGRPVVSVTQALGAAYGNLAWPFRSEFAMERGRHVHRALHLYVLGDLDWKSLSSYVAGFVASGIRFLTESGVEVDPAECERRLYSPAYEFAGTPDLPCILNRKRSMVDYKSGEGGWIAGPQLAAYCHLWQAETGEVIRHRYVLRLAEDGSYPQLIPYPSREDWPEFLAALTVYNRRKALA